MKPHHIIILVLLTGCVALYYLWRRDSNKLASAESVLTEKEATIKYLKSESGRTISQKPVPEISKADFEKHYADLARELKEDFNLKLRNVRTALQAEIQAQGKGVVTVVRDTIYQPNGSSIEIDSIFVRDGYLSLTGGMADRTFGYKYTYQDTAIFAISTTKKWLFGKESLTGSVRLSNRNARVISQTAVSIKDYRDKRFVVSVGAGYDPFGNRFVPSIHFGWALLKF
jgi:hypothetical protein